ncbi:MAG: hypothetical protein R3E83_18390 [Burkholderiaceae bacterium]
MIRRGFIRHGFIRRCFIGLLGSLALSGATRAAESLDFKAEHLLEMPMDMRDAALPRAPDDLERFERRFQFGLGQVSSPEITNTVPMFGLEACFPSGAGRGWLLSAFADPYRFSGQAADTVI